MSRVLLTGVGIAAVLATTAIFTLDVANAQTVRGASAVQTTAAVASVFEGVVLVMLFGLLLMSIIRSTHRSSKKLNAVWFPISLVVVALATTASIVVLVMLGKETDNTDILGGAETRFLVGTAVALGFAFATQLVFVVVYFVATRMVAADRGDSLHTDDGGHFSSQMRVKAIPYSQTTASIKEPKERQSMTDNQSSPPGSSGGRSAAETISSIRTSLSQKVRPVNSKTRLLSNGSRTGKRPASLESNTNGDEGFDSWDTSAVDPQNRQALDTSSPSPPRFPLETIPASPTTSRSASPGFPLDLEPPQRTRRRSRSYSPLPKPPPVLTTRASASELHIHPLFRADSPTPPPAATPGTSIIAAPDAARAISIRSLSRVRSGSLPGQTSPLSRQGSYESFKTKSPSPTSDRLSPFPADIEEERKMTPPLPDWVLNAGSRTSLTEYHSRKLRDREGKPESGLGISH
jgi:hypothetical protein